MKPAPFDYQAPGALRAAPELFRLEPPGDRHRRWIKPDARRCIGYIPIVEAGLEARGADRKATKP